MRVSMAFGSTERAACRACLRRDMGVATSAKCFSRLRAASWTPRTRRLSLGEQRVQLGVVGDGVRLDHRRVPLRHVTL
jgi:hypothetical protein